MNAIFTAAILVAGIGLIAGLVLAVFSVIMSVPKDEKVEKIIEVLPGANCGACGYSGCSGYAKALVKDGEKTNLCAPGGEAVSKKISDILGKKELGSEKRVAVVKCFGNCHNTKNKVEYQGINSCLAASQLSAGPGECSYGCIGFGDCIKVCNYGAISICDGVAVIDKNKCRGCSLCVTQCPKGLIKLYSGSKAKAVVYCSNKDKGAITRKICSAGCIGCMRCVKECKVQAIRVENNLAVVDTKKCVGCGKCVSVCKQGCIHI